MGDSPISFFLAMTTAEDAIARTLAAFVGAARAANRYTDSIVDVFGYCNNDTGQVKMVWVWDCLLTLELLPSYRIWEPNSSRD